MCPSVKNPDLVLQETGDSQGPTHFRPAECGRRQTIQAMLDHPDSVVSFSKGLPVDMHQVKHPYLAPRASAIKKQGFSEVVEARIEAPQRGSTGSAYKAKWTVCFLNGAIVMRWTL